MNRDGIVLGPSAPEKRELARQLRRSLTPAEQALWELLRGGRLGGLRFRRQQVIDGFIADFYCHAIGLVVECDGEIHALQQEYDSERDRLLTARGLRVLRVENTQVLDAPETVTALIREYARECLEPAPKARGRR